MLKISGKVSLSHVRIGSGGRSASAASAGNLVVNQASDIMPRLISGDLRLRFIYMQFKNGSPTPVSPALDDSISLYPALAPTEDYLRVPILAVPFIDRNPSDSEDYDGNRVILNAASDAADPVGEANGLAFTDGLSQVYSMGLVASSGPKSSDLLFSRVAVSATLKQAGFNLVAHWGFTFTSS